MSLRELTFTEAYLTLEDDFLVLIAVKYGWFLKPGEVQTHVQKRKRIGIYIPEMNYPNVSKLINIIHIKDNIWAVKMTFSPSRDSLVKSKRLFYSSTDRIIKEYFSPTNTTT